jgi:hypothetical protein
MAAVNATITNVFNRTLRQYTKKTRRANPAGVGTAAL